MLYLDPAAGLGQSECWTVTDGRGAAKTGALNERGALGKFLWSVSPAFSVFLSFVNQKNLKNQSFFLLHCWLSQGFGSGRKRGGGANTLLSRLLRT